MSIGPRGKGWQATVTHPRIAPHRWRRQWTTYEDAEIWEAQAKADLLAGRSPDMGGKERVSSEKPRTLREMIDYTAKTAWADKKAGDSLARNAELVGEVIGLDMDVRKIDAFVIDKAVVDLKGIGNSNGTINRKMASLSKCLSVATELGIIKEKPKIKRLREGVNRIRWFSDDELERMVAFFNHMGHEDMGHWVRFQADTGLRVGETRGLEWRDIQGDFVVLADTKSEAPRGLPMTQAVRVGLAAMTKHQKGPWAWADSNHIRRWWDRLRLHMDWEATGDDVPHALRHTFCSRLVQRGVPILTVKELAGHKSMEMTLRYAHLAPHNLVNAIKSLEPNRQPSLVVDVVA